jgi:hypothetical protein
MKMFFAVILGFVCMSSQVWAQKTRPRAYTELIDYVIQAPDQGDTNTCLFQATTGVMEILLNKKHGLKNQRPGDRYDLAEQFLIWQKPWRVKKSMFENPLLRFNWGEGIHHSHLPFNARTTQGQINQRVWSYPPGYEDLPRTKVTGVETETLFIRGNRWSMNVITDKEVELVKETLWRTKNPVLINYNDEGYWHVVVIVGYDDDVEGNCYDTEPEECAGDIGSFYVRDSFGVPIEVRDYDWFRVKTNAAFSIKEVSLASLKEQVQN